MTRTRSSVKSAAKPVARFAPRSPSEIARTLLNAGFSKMQTKEWFLIARTSAEAKLPNSICQAVGLGFEDLLPLLITAGILRITAKKPVDGIIHRTLEFSKDQIDTLKSNFINLDIKYTYLRSKDDSIPYRISHFIGRGQLGSKKPVYGSLRVATIKPISYSEKEQQKISMLRKQVEARYPFLAPFSSGESLHMITAAPPETQLTPPVVAAIVAPVEAVAVQQEIAPQQPIHERAVEHLDFTFTDGMRPSRVQGQDPILKSSIKQATAEMRMWIVFLALKWGWNQTDDNKRQRDIAEAACKAISYDAGFEAPIKGTRFQVWYQEIDDRVEGRPQKKQRKKYSRAGRVTMENADNTGRVEMENMDNTGRVGMENMDTGIVEMENMDNTGMVAMENIDTVFHFSHCM
jgi:hypothetical protein